MHEQHENFNKDTENITNYQTEVMELNTVTELKNSLEGFHSRLDQSERRISQLKDELLEVIQSKEQKEGVKKA